MIELFRVATARRCLVAGLAASAVLASTTASFAGPGHDHAPTVAATAALPRFAATSQTYELVGVLKGQQLKLYLDHADTNVPAKAARLAVEWAGHPLKLEPQGEAEFSALLPDDPRHGEIAILATVQDERGGDLLATTLTLDDQSTVPAHSDYGWRQVAGLTLMTIVLALSVITLRHRRRRRANTIGVTR